MTNRSLIIEMANAIKDAADLWSLRDALIAFEQATDTPDDRDNSLARHGIDVCELPTFGGDCPPNTMGVWSWDAEHVLAGEGPFREWRIIERKKVAA